MRIKQVLLSDKTDYIYTAKGWIRSFRNNTFIAVNDGSTNNNLQVVIDFNTIDENIIKQINTGAAIVATGIIKASLGKGQTVELIADTIKIVGHCDPEKYPLQLKNKPSLDYLREIAHLRFRTNTFGSVFRLRNALAFGIHKFFQERNFVYIHSPIITASDAEGAGEMFRVTRHNMTNVPQLADGGVDYSTDFFERSSHLTVSGQLEAELGAMALSDVYTFGPTFRAENSNTTRHLAEFWMIEPEIAFADITDDMNLAEDMLKYVINYAMTQHPDDIEFLTQRLVDEDKLKPMADRQEQSLKEKLDFVLANQFERITYTEAIEILLQSPAYKKKKFQYEANTKGTW
jgi:asparaginyl-tRNA synthetase